MSGSAVVATLSAAVSGTQAPTGWRCVRLVVKERIARPYRVTLDFLATEAGVNPASVIGTAFDVTYAWNNGISGQSGQRRWSGTLTQLTYMGRVHDTRFPVHYRAVLVPSLALAGMTRRSRAFVAPPDPGTCTVKDVLARLLQELGQTADQTNILDTSYPPGPSSPSMRKAISTSSAGWSRPSASPTSGPPTPARAAACCSPTTRTDSSRSTRCRRGAARPAPCRSTPMRGRHPVCGRCIG